METKRNTYSRSFLEPPEGKSHWKDPYVGGRIVLKRMLERQDEVVWTGQTWLRKGTSGRFLSTRQRTFESHKTLADSLVTECLLRQS
jgi:hypothetical protein